MAEVSALQATEALCLIGLCWLVFGPVFGPALQVECGVGPVQAARAQRASGRASRPPRGHSRRVRASIFGICGA